MQQKTLKMKNLDPKFKDFIHKYKNLMLFGEKRS